MQQGYVYAICDGLPDNNIKIGYSTNPKMRLKQLNTGNHSRLYILCQFVGDKELEKSIHSKFRKIRYNGEWMYSTAELVNYLNSMSNDSFIELDGDGKLRSYMKMRM